jgi:flagellar hook-associated protein FlgK
MNCPTCGAKSELVSYLYVQQLLDKKRKNQKLTEKILFHPSQSVDDLVNKRDKMLEELATIECKRFLSDDDEIRILVLTGKVQIVQSELTFLTMNELVQKLTRLFGV